jgi:hypothetical protein
MIKIARLLAYINPENFTEYNYTIDVFARNEEYTNCRE